jgi:hypothetical protein
MAATPTAFDHRAAGAAEMRRSTMAILMFLAFAGLSIPLVSVILAIVVGR